MSSRPQAPGPANVKIKQRKRNVATKFEPTVFRDSFVALVSEATSVEQYEAILFQSVDDLDYKKYGDPLFELMLAGCLVLPGGILSLDPAQRNRFSLYDMPSNDWPALRTRVDVVNKLVRRYKYLQLKLDDTLVHLLQYINKYDMCFTSNLADACGIMFALQLASLPILAGLFKDHLVKDGSSLKFTTQVFQSYLREQPLDHLITQLKKSGVGNRLLDFFPSNKRNTESLSSHFTENGLQSLVDYHLGNVQRNMKDESRAALIDMFKEDCPVDQMVNYAKEELSNNSWDQADIVPILWQSFIESIDWAAKTEQIEAQIVKELNTWAPVFLPFCTRPKTEVNLLLQIQVQCYEDARLMKIFAKMIQHLYKHDVLSENAIVYWYEKGAVPQGRNNFLKQSTSFINWLKTEEKEDSKE